MKSSQKSAPFLHISQVMLFSRGLAMTLILSAFLMPLISHAGDEVKATPGAAGAHLQFRFLPKTVQSCAAQVKKIPTAAPENKHTPIISDDATILSTILSSAQFTSLSRRKIKPGFVLKLLRSKALCDNDSEKLKALVDLGEPEFEAELKKDSKLFTEYLRSKPTK